MKMTKTKLLMQQVSKPKAKSDETVKGNCSLCVTILLQCHVCWCRWDHRGGFQGFPNRMTILLHFSFFQVLNTIECSIGNENLLKHTHTHTQTTKCVWIFMTMGRVRMHACMWLHDYVRMSTDVSKVCPDTLLSFRPDAPCAGFWPSGGLLIKA